VDCPTAVQTLCSVSPASSFVQWGQSAGERPEAWVHRLALLLRLGEGGFESRAGLCC